MERITSRGNIITFIKLVLMKHGLWGFVEGKENAPNGTVTDAA